MTADLVIVGSDFRQPPGFGHVYAFERKTGKLRWKYRTPDGVMTDILLRGLRLYAVTLEDRLVCLDAKTGRLLWSFPSGFSNPDFLFNSTPAADSKRVYFGGLNGTVFALDARTGKLVWKKELGARISTSLLLLRERLYLGTAGKRFCRLDKKSGELEAQLSLEETPEGPLVASGDLLFAFLGNRAVACLDASLKQIRWVQKGAVPWSSARPYVWNDTLIAGNEHGEVFAFRVTDGGVQWSEQCEGTIRGIGTSPETLYLGTLKGNLYAWSLGSP